jgi:phage terminase large subunit-like protein
MGGIGGLSPEKIKLEQIRRYQEEGLRYYLPHEKQLELHRASGAEIRAYFGGNRSGKTFWGCCEIAWTVGKCHPFRANFALPVFARDCCVSFSTIKSVLIPTYQALLPRRRCELTWQTPQGKIIPLKTFEGKPAIWPGLRGGSWKTAWSEQDKTLYMDEKDGGFIEFKSYEQGREAFQGATRQIIRQDEEPPKDINGENQARQLTCQPNMLYTLTPLNYSQWLYGDVYEKAAVDERVKCVVSSSNENPYVTREALERLADSVTDDAERAARLHGEFTWLSGRVWKEYGDHNLCDPFHAPDWWHKSIIIDPHPDKPTAVNMIVEDGQGRLFVTREADFTGDVKEICNQIGIMCGGQNIDLWLVDPSSRQATAIHGKGRLIDEFRKYIPLLQEANNNRELGWDAVRQRVKNSPNGPRLFVSRDCPITHHQMKNYMWKKPPASGEDRTKPDVHKKNDDHPDCVRYRVMAGSNFDDGNMFTGWGTRGYGN